VGTVIKETGGTANDWKNSLAVDAFVDDAASTANNALVINVNGINTTNIFWHAVVVASEVSGT
jgi:hypothetical protein